MSMPPSGDQPAYVDPVTGQPLFIDPATGQLAYTDPSAGPVPPAGYPAVPPYPAGYPAAAPPGYPAAGYSAAGYSGPGYSAPGYSTPGFPPPAYPPTAPYPPMAGYADLATYPDPYGAAPGSAFPTSGHFPNATDVPGGDPMVPYTGFTTPAFPPGPYGYGFPLQRRTNPLAITSMILSIVGVPLLLCDGVGGLLGLAGAILGHVARHQIKQRNDEGSGMALAGIIIGWITLAIALVGAILIVWFATHLDNYSTTTDY